MMYYQMLKEQIMTRTCPLASTSLASPFFSPRGAHWLSYESGKLYS